MPETRRRLTAAEGVQAAGILYDLNTEQAAILRMAEGCGFPPDLLQGAAARRLCDEWRAFVHAAVTAALMQHAPTGVVLAYLRQTHSLLSGDPAEAASRPQPATLRADELNAFVDGPFSAYMPLLAQGKPQACPALFCRRAGLELSPEAGGLAVQARLAAVMALLISTFNDRLEAYAIQSDEA